MIDLKNTTFIIPFNKDMDDRLRNLKYITEYILSTYDTNLIIAEQNTEYIKDVVPKQPNIKRFIIKNIPVAFHKTKLLNIMARVAKTPYLIQYDVDMITPPNQIVESINALESGRCSAIFPYAGKFYNVQPVHHAELIKNKIISTDKAHLVHPNSPGGALCWNKEHLKDIGWWNENFTLWGFEDDEIIIRAQRLGKVVNRSSGHIYHLSHEIHEGNSPRCATYNNNIHEFNKVRCMTQQQLREYVNGWSWK